MLSFAWSGLYNGGRQMVDGGREVVVPLSKFAADRAHRRGTDPAVVSTHRATAMARQAAGQLDRHVLGHASPFAVRFQTFGLDPIMPRHVPIHGLDIDGRRRQGKILIPRAARSLLLETLLRLLDECLAANGIPAHPHGVHEWSVVLHHASVRVGPVESSRRV